MGVNTDGEETNPKISLRDDNQQTTGSWQMENETEHAGNKKNIILHDDCTGGIQDQKLTLRSEPSQIGHQVVHDKRHLSHIDATSTKTGWKILSEHRNASTGRPPTILLFLQTFLQIILAAILLAGCPVHVGANSNIQEVTLLAGSRGVVPFYFQVPSNDTFLELQLYVLQFESQLQPFCVNGENDIGGFKSPTQARRFQTNITDLDTSPSVSLIIDNVETLDEDGYLFTTIFHHHSLEHIQYVTVKKKVFVQIPHGPAKCFITISETDEFPYEAHCRATSGSKATTISCYKNSQKLQSINSIADDGQFTRGIFFLPFNTRFACCSHEVTSVVRAAACNDFEWPPRKPRA